MNGVHHRGQLDPSSVLDDELPPILTTNMFYMSGRNNRAVADVVQSDQKVYHQPQQQVTPIISGYSPMPAMLEGRVTERASMPEHVAIVPPNLLPLNMQLQNTIASQRMMVKECVKTKLFSRLKFFKKDLHGLYDLRHGTVCSMIVANCNVAKENVDEYWWADMRKLVVCTHTDRRNNVIKNMRLRFRDGMCGKIPHFKVNNGQNADMDYMLAMRDNLVHYVHLIDIYAPCIVGHSNWNDKANMMSYCRSDSGVFNEYVFSLSDEAFMLLVLLNYTATWMSELALEQSKIQAHVSAVAVPVLVTVAPKYTLSRKQRNDTNGVAGIGWTEDGMNKFNDLYDSVKEDRMLHGVMFNNQLLNVFLERQRVVKPNPRRANNRKRKAMPRDDMGCVDTVCTNENPDGIVPI